MEDKHGQTHTPGCARRGAVRLPSRRAIGARRGAALRAALLALLRTMAALAAMATLMLAGCGPGLGGTGTGATQDALASYGAREVPVCEAAFADLLGCASPSGGAAPQPAAATRFFAEATPASRALLELDGQQAQLRLRCLDLVFVGSFGQAGPTAPRYFGNVIEGGSRAQLATLLVERSGSGVSITLVDSLGRTLAGPQGLLPVAGSTSAATCP